MLVENLTITVDTAAGPAETDRRTILIEAGLLLQLLRRVYGMPDLELHEPLPTEILVGGIIVDHARTAHLGVRALPPFSIQLKPLE